MNTDNIFEVGKKVIEHQSSTLDYFSNHLDTTFPKIVEEIFSSKGKVVVSGIGKSAIIAQKMVATFNSTGTKSVYLHAADAIHGDLGMIAQEDIVLVISKSGNSPEIKTLIDVLNKSKTKSFGITSNKESYLYKFSEASIYVPVKEESCPNNLAPTDSTTAQLVLGDAIAIALMRLNNFGSEDFATFHPGGSLGKNLLTSVADLVNTSIRPKNQKEDSIKEVILQISKCPYGCTVIVDDENHPIGVITDGDLRRTLTKSLDLEGLKAKDIMSLNPKTTQNNILASEALKKLKKHDIGQLIVTKNEKYFGIIDLHKILDEGII